MKLDETDIRILNILQKDGKITNAKLASTIGISPPAMLERVKRLESSGVITRFVALVDRKQVGIGIIALVHVSLAVHQMSSLDNFKNRIKALEEVLECYQISGDSDFMLKVALSSLLFPVFKISNHPLCWRRLNIIPPYLWLKPINETTGGLSFIFNILLYLL